MREIKFRAWQGGRFHYWGFIKSQYGDDYEFRSIVDTNAEPLTIFQKMERSQQYTGLKDKNSQECYHDDLVSLFGAIWQVVWDNYYACFMLKRVSGEHTAKEVPAWNIRNSVVIGNICENPELLTND